jgi:hypothetical protein
VSSDCGWRRRPPDMEVSCEYIKFYKMLHRASNLDEFFDWWQAVVNMVMNLLAP